MTRRINAYESLQYTSDSAASIALLYESEDVTPSNPTWMPASASVCAQLTLGRLWKRRGASTLRASLTEMQVLESLYMFGVQSEVQRYLESAPFLVPLLLDTYFVIRRYFPYSPMFLELVTDPEVIGDTELVIAIAPRCSPDEAVNRYLQLIETWWVDAMERVDGKLSIFLKYR